MHAQEREQLIHYVQKRWGGPHALRLGSESGQRLTLLPTGLHALDALLGGGLPAGRISTLRGGPSSGATTISHTLVAAAQRREYVPVYIDADRSFDPASAARSGVDLERLTIIRPSDALESLAIATTLARCGGFDLILFDRLSEEHDPQVVSTWLSCMATLLHSTNTALLILAAPRDGGKAYYGGQALAHYSSVILSARRTAWLRDRSNDITGICTQVRSLKNKTGAAPPAGLIEIEVHTTTPFRVATVVSA
ncbi:MAG: DNA recombination/repair protein RecA [Chloroflexota bacterium]|nr:DNA recombination/repair protein RecA [Chloroflexota bacterium]